MMKQTAFILAVLLLMACDNKDPANQPASKAPVQASQPSEKYSLDVVQAIPKPADMTVDIVVNGRVATVKHIDVAYVGKQIPFTFSDGKVANSEGFDWYVSKHFALRTDFTAERAKYFLELLELSYPYYVEFFAMEPMNIAEQRIASTYATSNDLLRQTMFDDGMNRGVHHTAGGEAMYYNLVGYSFPTERPQHRRYISIHETMHSYQMSLGNYPWTPSWYGEGQGDALAGHVWNSEKKQLAVYGNDIPIFDSLNSGLTKYREESPSFVDIHNRPRFHRGLNVLTMHFMHNNPEYSQYLKIYHQEIMKRQTASSKESLEVLQSIVPDWDKLEADFKAWVPTIKDSHQVAMRGPWEIDGNMFYKRKSKGTYGPQRVGLKFIPKAKPEYHPFSLDFPGPDQSDLLLPIQRGVAAPTVGYEIKYLADSNIADGSLGMALAVQMTDDNQAVLEKDPNRWKEANTDLDEQYRVEIKSGKTLVIDSSSLGGEVKEHALPESLVASLQQQDKPKLGVSIQLKDNAVNITVQAKGQQAFVVSETVSAELFAKLLSRPLGLNSKDNHHGITPYIDDGRDLNPHMPDYNQNAPANVWRFAGDLLARRLARAIWKTGKQAPQQWHDAYARLNQAALMAPDKANAELQAVEAGMAELIQAGANQNLGLAELSGVHLQIDWLGDSTKNLKEYAIIINNSKSAIHGDIQFTVAGESSAKIPVKAQAGERVEVLIPAELLTKGEKVLADLAYQWHGTAITQTDEQKTKKYPGLSMQLAEAVYQDGQLNIDATLFGPFNGKTEGRVTFDLYYGHDKVAKEESVSIKPYEVQQLIAKFKVEEEKLDHDAWIEVTVVVESDGEPITLRKRLPYVPAKFNR